MAVRSYTIDQLKALRDSPLVAKPENLPAIEQWIEYVYMEQDGVREKLRIPHSETAQSNQQNRQQLAEGTTRNAARQQRPGLTGGPGGESSPMGSFSTGRPTLGMRRETQRGQNGDDIALGPPRTMFPSSRNVSKLADGHDKTDATPGDEPESARSRFFSDRQLNRRSLNEKDGNDNRSSWSFRKDRGDEGEERGFGRHNKDHEGERRNGYGERHDPRWTRDERRQNGDRDRPAGGWREREAARRQREDHNEKEPEWMDGPLIKQEEEMGFGVARNADEFQKWKESMKKGKTDDEPDHSIEETPPPPPPETKPQAAPLKLEIDNSIFAGWGAGASATTPGANAPSTTAPAAKLPPGKSGKTSRFASMFKPVEPEPVPVPVEEPTPQPTNGTVKTTAEDHEGFNKMLAMLNQSKLTQAPQQPPVADPEPTSPPPPLKTMTSNGTIGKSKSRFANMWGQGQKSPERLLSPQQGGGSMGPDSMFDGLNRGPNEEPQQQQLSNPRFAERQPNEQSLPRTQGPESTMSPDHSGIPFNALREQQPRPGSSRVDNSHIFDPPSRSAPSPDVNVQNFLAQQNRRQHNTSMESQQLLNLLRNKGAGNSRPQSGQAQPNAGSDALQLQRLLEHQHQNLPSEPHQPKPRVPQQPPGLFEEQLMRNYPQDLPRQTSMQEMSSMHERAMQDNRRQMQQRPPPPGFFNEDLFIQQQQQQQQQRHAQQQAQLQRMHSESMLQQHQQHPQQPPRRMSNHPNLPQMQIPGSQSHQAQFQQSVGGDFAHHLTSPTGGGAPPPGFQQMPRHPPGFHNMNAFNQGQRDGPPPGFNGVTSPTSGPPGFFQQPPPGFAPQQMRGLAEQRGYDGFPPGMMPRR